VVRFKKICSFLLSLLLSISFFSSFIIPVQAATTKTVYIVDFPRSGDPNPNNWGHPELSFMGGWINKASNKMTLMTLGSYTGNIAYCIEPGIGIRTGNQLSQNGENFWDNYPDINPTISPSEIRSLIGRIFQYGYTGKINAGWKTNDPDSADELGKVVATQYLIWETIVGERDAEFNHVSSGSYDPILGYLSDQHPIRNQIISHYNRIERAVQQHSMLPSFLSDKATSAPVSNLEWDGSQYTVTLTDTNGVLSYYDFSCSSSSVSFKKSGNKLTITSSEPPAGTLEIKATRSTTRTGLIVWSDGNVGPGSFNEVQDLVTFGEEVSDTIRGYMKVKTNYGSVRLVKTSEDGVVENISFNISGNGINRTVTTNSEGVIEISNLSPGKYTISEKTFDRYEPQKSQKVTVIGGRTSTVTFSNTLRRGDVKVVKSSEDNSNEGVTFRLYGTSLAGIKVDEYAVTNAEGFALFEDIPISGTTPYSLEEVDTDERYVIPEVQSATVKWNEVTTNSFSNILKKFTVTAAKSDREAGTSQGDGTLAGAVYGLYQDGTLIDTYTTGPNGEFTTREYICGSNWTIQEISPSPGYMLDETAYKIGAAPGNFEMEHNEVTCKMTEQVIKGNISIIKHADNGDTQIETPEEGASFQIYLTSAGSYDDAKESERDILICDENGYATSKQLPYGLYTLHQTSGWEGYEFVDDFSVQISENEKTYPFIINNAIFTAKIEIVKKDAESGNIIPVAGVGFKIRNLSTGEWISQSYDYPTPTTIDTFYTSDTGKLMLPEPLVYGNYELVEQNSVYGYVLDQTPVPFSVDGSSEVVTVEKFNMPQKGKIIISKEGEVFASVTESNHIYQPIYRVQGLPGAIYDIIAEEDIRTPDGRLHAEKGKVVETLQTDEDGTASSELLYLGKYRILERQAPDKMVINSEPQIIELTYAGETIDVTSAKTSFYNERQKVEIDFSKLLETDDVFRIGNSGEILNVKFGLFAAEDLTAADGSTIPADALLEIVAVDENGHGFFTSDLPVGRYYVQELSSDRHYLTNSEKYPVEFVYSDQETRVVKLSVNNDSPIENVLKRGNIYGMKLDENGNGLAGATIGLFFEDEHTFNKETAIFTTTSDESGYFEFANVPIGNWIVKEISPAPTFVLSDELISVSVEDDQQIINIEIENRKIRGSVETTKYDADYPENLLTGAEFAVYTDADGDGIFNPETDKKVKKLTEISSGIYRADDLIYGRYFLHEEKGPKFFEKDDGYYAFSIEKDGAVVQVKNNAGNGFLNQAQTGKLKIVKTADDNSVEGRSFLVVGKTYSGQIYEEVFQTDASGEIMIENLRCGEYTISEIADSENVQYVLPEAQTVTIQNDETTNVSMHNRVKKGTLQIFKTDADTKQPIEGCGFELLDQDKNVVAQGYTDKEGLVSFENIPYGNYFYREFKVGASCYKLDDNFYEFSIQEDGEVVKKNMVNERLPEAEIPATGDPTNIALFATIMLLSSAGIIGPILMSRKITKKRNGIKK